MTQTFIDKDKAVQWYKEVYHGRLDFVA